MGGKIVTLGLVFSILEQSICAPTQTFFSNKKEPALFWTEPRYYNLSYRCVLHSPEAVVLDITSPLLLNGLHGCQGYRESWV